MAWSRTVLAFASVLGLIGVHTALEDRPMSITVPLLALSAVLLVANGVLTDRLWHLAVSDMGDRTSGVRPRAALLLASSTIALAVAALGTVLSAAGGT